MGIYNLYVRSCNQEKKNGSYEIKLMFVFEPQKRITSTPKSLKEMIIRFLFKQVFIRIILMKHRGK